MYTEVGRRTVVVSSPLGVVDNGKKLSLIVDFGYVYKHLKSLSLKRHSHRTFRSNNFAKAQKE